jgi:hypothetical protein
MRYSEMIAREKQRTLPTASAPLTGKTALHGIWHVAIWLAAAAVLLYWAL